MSAAQTILLGCVGALVQCLWKPKQGIQAVQAAFSVMNIAVAVYAAYYTYHWPLGQHMRSVFG